VSAGLSTPPDIGGCGVALIKGILVHTHLTGERNTVDPRKIFHRCSVSTLNRIAGTPRIASAIFAMMAFHDHWRRHASDELRFLAFCGSMGHISHGQILQDLWVAFELDLQPRGYFVEFGAHDGSLHSNTKLLEDRFGWTGLLVEPNPDMANVLRRNRSAVIDSRCVWDVTGETVELLLTGDSELSTVADHATRDLHTDTRRATGVRIVSVPTVSLNDLLDEHGAPVCIDFLSVDTEGTELRILQAFDFSKNKPRLVAVEHNHREDQRDLDVLMIANGYERRFRRISDWDAWYRLRQPPAIEIKP
jgi:FkbM family methyltransferase